MLIFRCWILWGTEMKMYESIWEPVNQQRIFRKLMDIMTRPGEIKDLAEFVLDSTAARGVLATLLDAEVSLSDHDQQLPVSDWPLLQANSNNSENADYIFCSGSSTPDFEPRLGTLPSPDLSATIIINIKNLSRGSDPGCLQLSGPGIKTKSMINIEGLSPVWLEKRESWICNFPLGVDMILVDQTQIVAIPRTTKVELC